MPAPVYATTVELALWGLPSDTLDTIAVEVQTAMLAGASRDVDRLASRFASVPFSSWGDDIKQAVCEIAAWKIMVHRGYNPEGDRDPLKDRANAAFAWILAAGAEGTLPGAVDATGPDVQEGAPIVYTTELRGW